MDEKEDILFTIGIVGLGVLGTAIRETFESFPNAFIKCYDKYKKQSINTNNTTYCNTLKNLLDCNVIFLCLPTIFDNEKKEFDKKEIYNVCDDLALYKYKGIIILKSTVEPKTTENISKKYKAIYPYFNIVHSPEFLSEKTATEDFKTQKNIIIGIVDTDIVNTNEFVNNNKYNTVSYLLDTFEHFFQKSKISFCSSNESESMKIFCNSFYASKIQIFTEYKLLCDKMNIDYNNVKDLMLSNNWINPMHTQVPGHDGKISFGGNCFPKDINALNEVFKKMNITNKVISSVIEEHNEMR